MAALALRGRLTLAPRLGVGVYAATLLAVSAGEARSARPVDAASLPLVFATMHVSYGVGFLAGCFRFGPPLAALRRIATGR